MKKNYTYTDIQNNLRNIYKIIKHEVKTFQKQDKHTYKSLTKNLNIKDYFTFLPVNTETKYENSIIMSLLGMVLNTSGIFYTPSVDVLNYDIFKNDLGFISFCKKIFIYKEFVNKKINVNLLSDINSIIIFYFIITEKNISETKILSLLSYFLKNSTIIPSFILPYENYKKIQMIITGIKNLKIIDNFPTTKNGEEVTNKKSKKVDVLQYLSTRITIKYISRKNGKHSQHKSPIVHIRKGHYRKYKSGKKWIKECVINPKNNITYNEIGVVSWVII